MKFIKTLDKRSSKLSFKGKIDDKKGRLKDENLIKEIEEILGGVQ